MKPYTRILDLKESHTRSIFLFGPRLTGKTSLLRRQFPDSPYYDLLQSDVFYKISRRQSTLREECIRHFSIQKTPVIIDEIQKLPALLDEVHSLIESHGATFILTGSSARKLKRGGANLLGGRARTRHLHPCVFQEISDFDLVRAVNFGTLPSIYQSDDPQEDLIAYCGNYLQEEIQAEGLVRKMDGFSRFLQVAALCNTELINYDSLASDTGVASKTVQGYFGILEDTFIGTTLKPYRKTIHRKAIGTAKFYFFDVGVSNCLAERWQISPKSELFGKSFEHFIFTELRSYLDYKRDRRPLCFWRDHHGNEVDFIIGDDVAIEVKGTDMVSEKHLKGLKKFTEEIDCKHKVVVSCDDRPRTIGAIEVMPWRYFLEKLWGGGFADC